MPLTFSITNKQMVQGVTVAPKTEGGDASEIEAGSLKVGIIDGNPNASGRIEADGTLSFISGDGVDGLGTTVFKVSGDSDVGEGVEEIGDTVTLVVAAEKAKDIGLGGGTVVDKPAPTT